MPDTARVLRLSRHNLNLGLILTIIIFLFLRVIEATTFATMKLFKCLTIVVLLALPAALFAQDKPTIKDRLTRDISITASAGVTHFWGDLRQYDFAPVFNDVSENRGGIGLSLNKGLSNTLSLQFAGLYGALQGVRRGKAVGPGYPRGRYFNTNILEGSTRIMLNVNNILSPYRERFDKKWGIYAFAGLGLVQFDTKVYLLDTDAEVNATRGVGPTGKTTEAVATIGSMLKYHLNNKMDLGLEASYRFVNTDRLDGWEGPGSDNDRYSFLALNFTYHFGVKEGEVPRERKSPMDEMMKRMEALEGGKVHSTVQPVNKPAAPLDGDRDGVTDDKDKQLHSPDGATVDADGVAADADGDGVPDAIDIEPNTPAGSLVNFKGQKIEPGEKVIERIIEKQVGGGGTVPSGGTAPVREDLKQLNQLNNIYFDTDSDQIRGGESSKLDALAKKMKSNTGLTVKLVGVADFYGEEPYNLQLSTRRAQAAKKYLTSKHGIAANRVEVDGQGEVQSHPSDASKHRRVDIYEQK